jgi:hypothetical protein
MLVETQIEVSVFNRPWARSYIGLPPINSGDVLQAAQRTGRLWLAWADDLTIG